MYTDDRRSGETQHQFGTAEHIAAWLDRMPAGQRYTWSNPWNCACAQYHRAHRDRDRGSWLGVPPLTSDGLDGMRDLNRLADNWPYTFGALRERVRQAWGV